MQQNGVLVKLARIGQKVAQILKVALGQLSPALFHLVMAEVLGVLVSLFFVHVKLKAVVVVAGAAIARGDEALQLFHVFNRFLENSIPVASRVTARWK